MKKTQKELEGIILEYAAKFGLSERAREYFIQKRDKYFALKDRLQRR